MAETGGNNAGSADLDALRAQIDELDRRLVELLNARAEVVVKVGQVKQISGSQIYAPDREKAVLDRVAELNKGPLPQRTLQAIYREMMSGSFALERPLRVGYLGPEGSFSHMAAMRKFGASIEYLPLADIRAVFEESGKGHIDLGLVPIENSIGGGVIDTMDAFAENAVQIVAEVLIEVHHNLLANCSPDEITMIASKPEIFAQCRNWLSRSLHKVDLIPVASSAKAAEMASQQHCMAAIGSILAAELYDLKIVFANIEDNVANTTRFFVIGKGQPKPTGNDKTVLMFTTLHKAGALVEVLNVLGKFGINMTNIDTRPSKRQNWEYYFFIDCEGHIDEANMKQAIEEAQKHCLEMHVLGSFPKATNPV
ncbi:MAG: prephenate dehydratase [Planctomycetota bacterium]|nr:prephenate dehydratase [Planctomycetota bacterium]